ncbi:hydrophobin-domain-containing protein [Peniophora sp. CONT]|nr:hydrophobin-domain-containing protein [Peniophora sp. CONT]
MAVLLVSLSPALAYKYLGLEMLNSSARRIQPFALYITTIMFSRLLFVVLAAAGLVAAAPQAGSACNSGALQCCNSIQNSSSLNESGNGGLLDLIPIALQGVNIPIGLTCTPIDVLGLGSNTCQQQTACCTGNTFSGAVTLGCSPVALSL